MKINDLIRLASSAYVDNFIAAQYWDFKNHCPDDVGDGDTLALFIARELWSTFSPSDSSKDQLVAAIQVMDRAKEQLGDVSFALEQKLDELYRKKGK